MPISRLEGCRLREQAVGTPCRSGWRPGPWGGVFDSLVRNIPAARGEGGWGISIGQCVVIVGGGGGVIVEPDHHSERLVRVRFVRQGGCSSSRE